MSDHESISTDELFLVTWKKQKGHCELFADLDVFARSYLDYSAEELKKLFAFGRTIFEDDKVLIERKAIILKPKPDLPRVFFWDFDYDKMDWHSSATAVIQRVLERGSEAHWRELERFYGHQAVVNDLKQKVTFLPAECVDEVSYFFTLEKEEMLCRRRKQSLPGRWR